MGIRLKEWYESGKIDDLISESQIKLILKCLQRLNIKVPHYIFIKILELSFPPIFEKTTDNNDPMNLFLSKLSIDSNECEYIIFDSDSYHGNDDLMYFYRLEDWRDAICYGDYNYEPIISYKTNVIVLTIYNLRGYERVDKYSFTIKFKRKKNHKSFILNNIKFEDTHPQYHQIEKLYDKLLCDIKNKYKTLKKKFKKLAKKFY